MVNGQEQSITRIQRPIVGIPSCLVVHIVIGNHLDIAAILFCFLYKNKLLAVFVSAFLPVWVSYINLFVNSFGSYILRFDTRHAK